MADIRVLMMGGERSGKTSILAGLFDIMSEAPVSNIIRAEDATVLETKNGVVQDSLNEKIVELKKVLSEKKGKTILVDDTSTDNFWNYTLRLHLMEADDYLDIVFTDTNGEFYESGDTHNDEVEKLIEEADIIVVVVDTPSIMQSADKSDTLCTTAVCRGVNRVDGIHNFLSDLNDAEGHLAKQIIFVPVKCEKWAKEGKLDDVRERVEKLYDTPLKRLKSFDKFEIDIIPVQTAGNIVFKEYREPYVAINPSGVAQDCCFLDDDTVRLADGASLPSIKGWHFQENAKKVIKGTDILKPDPWYRIAGDKYTPEKCEQLAFYIIRFIFKKYEDMVKQSNGKRGEFFGGMRIPFFVKVLYWPVYRAYKKMIEQYDTALMKDIETILTKLSTEGLILENTCGIKMIKSING